MRDHLILHNTN